MKGTGIQWADDTVNPTSGCQGCELWTPGRGGPCYAGNFHEMRLSKSLPALYAPTFDEVRLIPGRMAKAVRCMDLTGVARPDKPWLDGLRRKIFVGDLGDLFSSSVPDEYIVSELFDVAESREGRRHDLLALTKQPQRAASLAATVGRWPENVWIGTSVTGPASRGRIAHLRRVPAKVRYLSLEPLLADPKLVDADVEGISWLIVGGESRQGAHPPRQFSVSWVRSLLELCARTGVAAFVKQMGDNSDLPIGAGHGGDWNEWPEDVRVRQMPTQACKSKS